MPTRRTKKLIVPTSRTRTVFFFTLMVIFTITMVYLFRPFFYPLFWAAVIAVVAYPWYEQLSRHMHSTRLGALFALATVLLVLIVPLLLIALLLFQESVHLYAFIAGGGYLNHGSDSVTRSISSLLSGPFEHYQTTFSRYTQEISKWVSTEMFTGLSYLTQNVVRFVVMLFLMLYTLYYFLKDGPIILKQVIQVSPLDDGFDKQLFARFADTIRATLKSSLVVALVQGLCGLVLFWVTGVQGALVWAVLMALLGLIPAFGSFLVWLPLGVVMLASGHTWQGVLILVVGGVVISTIDNILRPILVRKNVALHPVIILFSTLGGVLAFGASGIVMGPVIASMYAALLSVYEQYYK